VRKLWRFSLKKRWSTFNLKLNLYLGIVYAIFSIGLLGFLVWSYIMMASLYCEIEFSNLAICWNSSTLLCTFNSENHSSYTQSAGNRKLSTSSSETTRETSFQFNSFRQTRQHFDPDPGALIPHKWLEWFVGFAEGDGSIMTRANLKRATFVLTQKEGEILYHIQSILGFGVVRHISNGNYYRYIVEDTRHIFLLCLLFNGNLVLPYRIRQLEKWICFINENIQSNTSRLSIKSNIKDIILFIDKPAIITLQDAWLSGFCDAEGTFNIQVSKRPANKSTGYSVYPRFILDQNDSLELFIYINSLFGSGHVYHRKDTPQGVYRFTLDSVSGLTLCYEYFTHFPLKTKKLKSFQIWTQVINLIIRKEHLTYEGVIKIRQISKMINLRNSQTRGTGKSLVWKMKI